MKRPNFLIIMTDTQNQSMVGAYGNPSVDTPNLDRLASTGVRFDNAYTTCPLCTPARGSLFSGMYPQNNGAWTNNIAPSAAIPLMGTIFAQYGYRVGYTGKWHLDGSSYFGDGQAGGGFPQQWWYDGKCYADEIGDSLFQKYVTCKTPEDIRQAGFVEETIWGHRVADKALEFLESIGGQPYMLVVSFDEPHRPSVAPAEYWERLSPTDIPQPLNYNASVVNKPELQNIHRTQVGDILWEKTAEELLPIFACNSYIDREIGRVIDAADNLDSENTVIIYTSDHGDMMGAHGLTMKGPMMYQETTLVPLIVRTPLGLQEDMPNEVEKTSDGRRLDENRSVSSVVSHLDIIPTMLDMIGAAIPDILHGQSLLPVVNGTCSKAREEAFLSFHRFAINHDKAGGFYPIRCIVDGRYKLVINLFDSDEFYDLHDDPLELENRIADADLRGTRNRLHDRLLDEMDKSRDPFRSFEWGDRRWRTAREKFYYGGKVRNRPSVFFFQADCIEPRGTHSYKAPKEA